MGFSQLSFFTLITEITHTADYLKLTGTIGMKLIESMYSKNSERLANAEFGKRRMDCDGRTPEL